MKTRTIGLVVVFIIMSLMMVSMQVGAHSPRYMKLTYDSDTLTVLVLHISPFRQIHHIYKIDIEKNGQLTIAELFDTQQRIFFNVYSFNVTAVSGDILTVTANCNLFGNIERSLTIP